MTADAKKGAVYLDAIRLAPHSLDAEQAVLGGLLLDNTAWPRVANVLTAADFYRADHRLIFEHIALLVDVGDPADAVTVAEHLNGAGKLQDVGGQAYIGALALNTASAANIVHYAKIVREHAQRREIAAIGLELHDGANAPGADALALRREAEKRLNTITPATRNGTCLDWLDLATREPPERAWALFMWIALGVPTLLVGAGGAGKTLLMLQLGACLALARHFIDDIPQALRVLMWCCEDDADELWRRMVKIAR